MSYKIEEKDIVISGFETGIADDPYKGIGDMRNIDFTTVSGEASVAQSVAQSSFSSASGNITGVNTTTGVVGLGGSGLVGTIVNGMAIKLTGADLPNGLFQNTAYYIGDYFSGTVKLYTNAGATSGNVIPSDQGTGVMTWATIDMGIPKYFADYNFNKASVDGGITYTTYDIRFDFLVDSNGRCWVYDNSNLGGSNKWVYMHNLNNESSTTGGNGLVAYKDTLFSFNNEDINAIRLINPNTQFAPRFSLAYLTTRANWVIPWKIVSAGAPTSISHYAIVAQDNCIYFCNNNNVGKIGTVVGQNFALAPTSTTNTGVTTLNSNQISTTNAFFFPVMLGAVITGTNIPANATITAIADNKHATIGNFSATANGVALTFTVTQSYTYSAEVFAVGLPVNDKANCLAELGVNLLIGGINNFIYPWDRSSTNFSYPIFLSENFVSRMVTINTTCYLFIGYRGRIYMTNGTNVSLFRQVPDYISDTVNPYILWTDATFNRNQLYFGFQVTNNAGTTNNKYGGLWAIDMKTNGLRLQNIMSPGNYSTYVSAIIPNRGTTSLAIPSGDGYGLFMGWYTGTVGGVDIGISTPYTGGQSYVDSDIIPIGTFINPFTPTQVEWKVSTPLVANENVQLYYRTNLTEAFTLIPTTASTLVGVISDMIQVNFQKVQWIQLRAVLTSTATNPSYCRLTEIRLREIK